MARRNAALECVRATWIASRRRILRAPPHGLPDAARGIVESLALSACSPALSIDTLSLVFGVGGADAPSAPSALAGAFGLPLLEIPGAPSPQDAKLAPTSSSSLSSSVSPPRAHQLPTPTDAGPAAVPFAALAVSKQILTSTSTSTTTTTTISSSDVPYPSLPTSPPSTAASAGQTTPQRAPAPHRARTARSRRRQTARAPHSHTRSGSTYAPAPVPPYGKLGKVFSLPGFSAGFGAVSVVAPMAQALQVHRAAAPAHAAGGKTGEPTLVSSVSVSHGHGFGGVAGYGGGAGGDEEELAHETGASRKVQGEIQQEENPGTPWCGRSRSGCGARSTMPCWCFTVRHARFFPAFNMTRQPVVFDD
ncbi:hypothetical protein DFH11DRAFT_1809868 [Phellopilus nigrolimitatus]|nr:hypothetical protein DFH11DRAFT_1809868 [Phellopilus nigrolimitatus]